MPDREKLIKGLQCHLRIDGLQCKDCPYWKNIRNTCVCEKEIEVDALELLKEQEKKQITLHKKHIITWKRDDKFTIKKLYEAICETLLDEGELFIARTDDHEKVDFTFYVTQEGR